MNSTKQSKKFSRKSEPLENPYDIETVFHSMKIASDNHKEMLFMDRLIGSIRANPNVDLTEISYNILKTMGIIKI
jgi:hypothetical protein